MGTAWTYEKDMSEEHVAIRTKAGIMDVSGLKKVHLVGPHAIAVLDYITTRDMTKIYPGRSVYACMLNDRGHFTDDCIVLPHRPQFLDAGPRLRFRLRGDREAGCGP